MGKRIRGNFMLLLTAFIWGTAFVAQSAGMDYVQPFTYNAFRTLLGALVLIPVVLVRSAAQGGLSVLPDAVKNTAKGGICCGVILFAASSFQQCGISMTTAGKAGFITALYIVIVPVIELVFYKKSSKLIWICVFAALSGFYLLCIKEDFSIGTGDMLVLAAAFLFALHIMVIDKFNARGADGVIMSCIQFFTAGLIMLLCMFLFEEPNIKNIAAARLTIFYGGVMSCGVAYTLQIIAQRYTAPAEATLIMSMESVFAALSGWLLLGEILSVRELVGCGLVFAAVLTAQLKDIRKEKTNVKKR